MSNSKKVSVLLSTYNRLELLKICLKKINTQTYKNLEIIIVNDFSNDGTKEFLDNLTNEKIIIIHNKNNVVSKFGHMKIWQMMLAESTGELIINISDDDYWIYNEFIEECVLQFNKFHNLSKVIGNQVDYYYTNDFEEFDKEIINNKIISEDPEIHWHKNIMPNGLISSKKYLNLYANRPLDINISTSGTMFNKKIFLESFTLQHQDVAKWQGGHELHIPSSFVGDIYFINKPCVLIGLKKNSLSFGNTQIDHLNDTIKSINNSFINLKKIKINKDLNIKDLIKIKKRMIFNAVKAYWFHSIEIFRKKELSLCTEGNIKKYVSLLSGIKILFKNKIFYLPLRVIIFYLITFVKYRVINKF